MTNVPEPTANPGDARALRNLLTAVLEAVTLPHDTAEHARRMQTRADWVRATLKGALADDPADIGWNADYLRSKLTAEETEAADRAKNRCARCRNPFNQDDPAFDGRARHRDTPYCGGCVDACHDGGTEHVCVICDPARYGAVR
ncbi:hypothetical protein ACIOK4_13300 [Streptomyces bottropensis]|uniref:hypothetical protein n=1 Tax=Streptomyces bottropensis TaxID=42235 RepID=UPI003803445C